MHAKRVMILEMTGRWFGARLRVKGFLEAGGFRADRF